MKPARTDYATVRIKTTTHERLGKLVEQIARVGWNAVGSDRADAAGIGSVVDQALVLLEERLKENT